jgi:hypothetical protein
MSVYENLKHQLAQLSVDTMNLVENAEKLSQGDDAGFSQWKTTCRTIGEQISEEVMRVAVVGAIKSGKSTFVNTLFAGDYLKRGAGVVTSIVTRVRAAHRLRATLDLKSWEDVNREIDEAAVLLPAHKRSDGHQTFDLRRETDRRLLGASLNELAADQLIANDTRSAGSVLLDAYLKGYDRLQQFVEVDHATVLFDKERFPLHRDFVGDDAMSVYLRDVLLEIDSPGLGETVEIADCQGSDSPNPLHMAMIQDYLAMAHLTIYVISSRTGLRQADIRFLSMIRKMGILNTVIFVVNCDLSEHESMQDLTAGIRNIEADLGLIYPNPPIFAYSALFLLMSQMESKLTPRDRDRLTHWRREAAMIEFTTAEQKRFQRFLEHKINRERSGLLLKNHVERLEIVADGLGNWVGFHLDLLARDSDSARDLADRVHRQRGRLDRMQRTVKNTLDGSVNQVKRDLKTAIDRFFDGRADGVVDGVVRFLRGYQVEMQRFDESLAAGGFAKTLYLVFQEFKQALNAHMAETVNPEIIRFVKTQEKILMDYLDEIAGPYGAMIDEALAQYSSAIAEGRPPARKRSSSLLSVGPELETIRKAAGLSLPPATATMHYSAQIKTEAVMRFGFYKIVNLFKKAMKRSANKVHQEQFLALASAVKRMKRETERTILFHLKDYKENIKFQYLLKLADAAAAALHRQMLERFQYQGTGLSQLMDLVNAQRLDKEKASTELARMDAASKVLQEKIGGLKAELKRLTSDRAGRPDEYTELL